MIHRRSVHHYPFKELKNTCYTGLSRAVSRHMCRGTQRYVLIGHKSQISKQKLLIHVDFSSSKGHWICLCL